MVHVRFVLWLYISLLFVFVYSALNLLYSGKIRYIIIFDFGESVVNDMNTINQVFNFDETMELVKRIQQNT